eukprot:1160865-Pelagomonas_calceolata.AAC.11
MHVAGSCPRRHFTAWLGSAAAGGGGLEAYQAPRFPDPHFLGTCTCAAGMLGMHTREHLASKAQKASVTREEVHRYLEYDARHGAKYVEAANDEMDEDDWIGDEAGNGMAC